LKKNNGVVLATPLRTEILINRKLCYATTTNTG